MNFFYGISDYWKQWTGQLTRIKVDPNSGLLVPEKFGLDIDLDTWDVVKIVMLGYLGLAIYSEVKSPTVKSEKQ